jgi:hypothetical protein
MPPGPPRVRRRADLVEIAIPAQALLGRRREFPPGYSGAPQIRSDPGREGSEASQHPTKAAGFCNGSPGVSAGEHQSVDERSRSARRLLGQRRGPASNSATVSHHPSLERAIRIRNSTRLGFYENDVPASGGNASPLQRAQIHVVNITQDLRCGRFQ